MYRTAALVLLPGEEDFGIVPVEAQACGTPVVALGRGGALETVVHGRHGHARRRGRGGPAPTASADALATAWSMRRLPHGRRERFSARAIRRGDDPRRARSDASRPSGRCDGEALQPPARGALRRRPTRSSGWWRSCWPTASASRPASSPSPRATRPSGSTCGVLPFVGVLVPLAFHLQGIYRLRRGRSRVDDFFAVLVGSILAVVLGVVSTLYFQAYYVPDAVEGPRRLRGLAARLGPLPRAERLPHLRSRASPCATGCERRWRAGIGLKRVLIAGAGDLGRARRRQASSSTASSATRSSASSTTGPRAATTSATAACRCSARSTRPPRSCSARRSTSSTSRCRSTST